VNKKVGIVMDPIESINIKKDSSFAMLLEAQAREYDLFYMQSKDLYVIEGKALATASPLSVKDDPSSWFELGPPSSLALAELDVILMRQDPPFDMEYINTTYILERAEAEGCLIVNKPQALRDANEKMFISWFPQCAPPTLVTRDAHRMKQFIAEHHHSVIKPLDGMGGASIFQIKAGDQNTNVILETVSAEGSRTVMLQRYIPEITAGDKRILLVNGQAVEYALARIPSAEDFRGNLARGGSGKGVALSDRDHWICEQLGPELKKRGVIFAGIDVIGDYLTEINVTSPTCIRELDSIYKLNIAATLFDMIEQKLGTP